MVNDAINWNQCSTAKIASPKRERFGSTMKLRDHHAEDGSENDDSVTASNLTVAWPAQNSKPETPIPPEFGKRGAGYYVEYLGVRKWVVDNTMQGEIDRKAIGKNVKPTKQISDEESRKARRKYPVIGNGDPWKESSIVKTSVLFMRGCGEKPPEFTNPLDGNSDPLKKIIVSAK